VAAGHGVERSLASKSLLPSSEEAGVMPDTLMGRASCMLSTYLGSFRLFIRAVVVTLVTLDLSRILFRNGVKPLQIEPSPTNIKILIQTVCSSYMSLGVLFFFLSERP
jgi:hypothetical protein